MQAKENLEIEITFHRKLFWFIGWRLKRLRTTRYESYVSRLHGLRRNLMTGSGKTATFVLIFPCFWWFSLSSSALLCLGIFKTEELLEIKRKPIITINKRLLPCFCYSKPGWILLLTFSSGVSFRILFFVSPLRSWLI